MFTTHHSARRLRHVMSKATVTVAAVVAIATVGIAGGLGAAAGEPPTSDPADPPFVRTADSPFGPILVDGAGLTLYLFTPDTGGQPMCVDDCAAAWPPLFVDGDEIPPVADDLDPDGFAIVEHAEGSMLSYCGWPLYHFAADSAPDDIAGQGVQEVWWVVAPDGTMIDAEPATEPAADATAGADAAAATVESAPDGSVPAVTCADAADGETEAAETSPTTSRDGY